MAKKYVQIPTAYLSGSGVVLGATSITINAFTDIYGNNLTMADFGDSGYATLEPDTTNEESFTFTSITANTNGTVTLGGIKTSLAKDPYTETSGLIRSHVGGSKVVVSDTAAFWATFANKNNDETILGRWSSSVTPINPADLANKAYVDLVGTGTATYSQNIFSGTAGETLASGNIVYYRTVDQRWWKASSAAAATAIGVKLGVAQGAATAGSAVNILGAGLTTNLSGLTVGGNYFLSTAGAISLTAGTFARFIGRAVTATSLHFDPSNGYTISTNGQEIYGTDSVGTDAYAVTLSPAITAYSDGMVVNFKAGTANTGAATLSVNGLAAKSIRKAFNATLSDNDIKVNQIVTVVYESVTDTFQMQSQTGNDVSATSFDNYIFGDGADGTVTFDGATTILGMIPAANVYTMTRDIFLVDCTINTGVTINTAGYRIFGTRTLTGNGTAKILRNGAAGGAGGAGGNGTGGAGGTAGTAGTAGAVLAAGSVGNALAGSNGGAGGAGGTFAGAGGNGNVGTSAGTLANSVGSGSPAAASGVAGGAGGGTGAGSAAGAAASNSITNPVMMPRVPQWAMAMHYMSGATLGYMGSSNSATGGSGGSGGGGGTNEGGTSGTGGGGGGGGAGGSSGGIVCVAFKTIVSPSSSFIQALGGTGGAGGNGGNGVNNGGAQRGGGGGGGGGGTGGTGGIVVCIYKTFNGTALVESAACAGGAGGAGGTGGASTGAGTGVAGSNGNTGTTGNNGKLYLLAI